MFVSESPRVRHWGANILRRLAAGHFPASQPAIILPEQTKQICIKPIMDGTAAAFPCAPVLLYWTGTKMATKITAPRSNRGNLCSPSQTDVRPAEWMEIKISSSFPCFGGWIPREVPRNAIAFLSSILTPKGSSGDLHVSFCLWWSSALQLGLLQDVCTEDCVTCWQRKLLT